MICCHCKAAQNRVVDSRPVGKQTRRRYHCRACQGRFTTYEMDSATYAQFVAALDAIKAIQRLPRLDLPKEEP